MPEQTDTTAVADEHVEKYGITAEEAEQARAAQERKAADDPEAVAYEAGRAAADDAATRRAGAAACPFSPVDHPDERRAWFKGLSDVLDEIQPIDALRAEVEKETSPDA